MVPSVGSVKLKKLSAMHVQGMYRSMLDRDLSSRTVQYTHAVLYRALKQAMRWSLVPHNVCEDVDRPRPRREEMQPLDRDQARHLLKTAEGDRFEALHKLAVYTGMRPGELLGLKWEDVDLGATGGSLRVNRALSGGKLTTPKTKRSRRRINLSAGSIIALKAHCKRQLEERLQKAGSGKITGWFPQHHRHAPIPP